MTSLARHLDPFLEPILTAVRRVERFLGPDDDWVEDDRRIVFEAAQRLLGGVHEFTTEKTRDEYVFTVNMTPDAFEQAITPTYQRNLASSRKYRTDHDGGRQWACGSYVVDPPNQRWQHHVYIFEAPDGRTDVYAHKETSVREGAEHLYEPQVDADPHVLPSILRSLGVEHGRREF